ncbi:MAG: M3 family metallopeptidase [Bacteroidales bacterium]|jgi:peptidyl-dipeptidase Dcp|nr:M3 family metallopeptidase [Bacteroidales bacterium]MBP8981618.1 M3 family metallopeptidase [Bacteroidales bacterium]NLV37974.1 M3 family metallopeptidase [Bacteroidales bacterium]HNZ80496.1 M3 family metallopeptidase [Bacteroidales bacterium]HOD26874.1 M3 family metallopeptidase [Bacteroidales bacterium]
MKTKLFFIMTALTVIGLQGSNPFLGKYKTLHETAPFREVKIEHILPAYQEAIRRHDNEIQKITANKEPASFANTIEALERSGELLDKISAVYYTLLNNQTCDELMNLSQQISPLLSEHHNNIVLNDALYQRIKTVYDNRENLNLNTEQSRLLWETYMDFLDSGATLEGADREKYRELSTKLSQLSLNFGQNVLKATNAYSKVFTDKTLLSGIPEDVLSIAAEKAKAKGLEGWLFDLTAPSYGAFLKYADNRELREEMYRAYMGRGLDGEFNNQPIIRDIVNARLEMAGLFGYPDYASYVLRRRMTKNSETVYGLLDQLREAYLPLGQRELSALQGFALGYEKNFIKLEAWDWSYYSQKLKDLQFNLNDEMLKPYFKLDNVIEGVFGLATKLYGLSFKKNNKIQVWHEEVTAYEVFDKDGSFLAVLYTDFHPRASKRSGAWMSYIKAQHKIKNKDIRPHITLSTNFTPSTSEKPSLLTFDEVTTFLHEFGHALHGMLSNTTYASLSGTNVYRDFVELPSQIMENWGTKQEFLNTFAVHYQSGEQIPAKLIEKIIAADNFNVGYACLRQLSFGYLDMAWHGLQKPFDGDVRQFENQAWSSVILLPQPGEACMSTSFNHIFSGGYAAGYYGYKWAEVLDADAFEYFTENDVFDTERAASFRENILSRGGTEDPMELYLKFRGREPRIDALLKRNGIK